MRDVDAGSTRVFVVYDFACPYSYIAQHEVDRLHDEFVIELPVWRPYVLHPDVAETGRPFASVVGDDRIATVRAWLAEMSPELGRDIAFPERQPYSLHALAAMEFARDRGAAAELRRAVFRATWVDSRDIGRRATVDELLDEVGLDPGEFHAGDPGEVYRRRALAASKKCQQLGLTTTPTVLLGRTAVVGWHYYEVLARVLEDCGVARRAA